MAGIIKNQLLKHLSRFVKHLSSDRINVSTLKGEGEMTNLDLDEDVLTDLLALPTWMKIKKAHCNRVNIRIPWTRLKSHPILLALDHVYVQIETCEELRKTAADTANHFASSAGKYGFVNKVVDGITLTVESVEMIFHSREFESRVQISRIRVESRSPQWRSNVELSHSRLKDVRRGEVLVFKEVIWQNLRLEAQSTSDRHLAPLRLLTNQAKARIVIKKRLNDCQVVACRLSVILDELLWVLTDSQILAALHFINSLSGLVKQATEESQRIKAKRKLEVLEQPSFVTLPEYQAQQHQATAMNSSGGGSVNDAARIFEAFDIKETSYHFVCDKINLHLLDDPGKGRSIHPDLTNGAALQIHFSQIMLDFYPYHLARASRKSWPRYGENQVFNWLKEALESFNMKLMETILPQQALILNQQLNEHRPLARAAGGVSDYQNVSVSGSPVGTPSRQSNPPPTSDNNAARQAVGDKIAKLMSTCLVIRIQNVCIYKVTTNAKESLQPFLSGYMERPKDLHGIHIEFTWFYHPGEVCFPLPSPKIYAYLHPLQMDLDTCTVLWLNAFVSNLTESLNTTKTAGEEPYADIRLELIQPKILYKCKSYPGQKARPTALYFQLSRVVLANYRSYDTGTHSQLSQCLEKLDVDNSKKGSRAPGGIHYQQSYSLNNHQTSAQSYSDKLSRFYRHCNYEDLVRQNLQPPSHRKIESFQDLATLSKEMLWTEPRDIWHVSVDTFWADFCFESVSSSGSGGKKRAPMARFESIASETGGIWGACGGEQLGPPSPFIDPLPLSGWIYTPAPPDSLNMQPSDSGQPLCVLLTAQSLVNVQMTHYQYLFLMRMVEAFGELSLFLNLDTERVIGEKASKLKELFLLLHIPRIEVSFLFPSLPPQLPRDTSLASENGTQSSPSPSAEFSKCGAGFPKCTPLAVMMMQSAVSEPSLSCHQQQLSQQQPQSMVNSSSINPLPVPLPQIVPPPTLDTRGVSLSTSKVGTPMSVGASPVNKPMPTLDMFTDNFKQGMKQGLSTVLAFSKTGGLSTPDSEVASTFSTSGSSDNIQFEHLELEGGSERGTTEVDPDGVDDHVEIAMEVVEDDSENAGVVADSESGCAGLGGGMQTTVVLNPIVNGPRSHDFDTVNVLVVQLDDVIVCQEAIALDSDIRVNAGSLNFDEAAEVQWQEFQRKFIAQSKKWKTSQVQAASAEDNSEEPPIGSPAGARRHHPLRHPLLTAGVTANCRRQSPSASFNTTPAVQVLLTQKIDGNMVKAYDWHGPDKPGGGSYISSSAAVKVNLIDAPGDTVMRKLIVDATQPGLQANVDLGQGQELVFNMSNLVNLTDLVEDEIVPVPFPFEIKISGGRLKLIEDRPPVNFTSPGVPPIKIAIPQTIHIRRDEYGVIYFGEKGTPYGKDGMTRQSSTTCDLLKSLTINDYRGEDEEDDDEEEDDDIISGGSPTPRPNTTEQSAEEKYLRKLNKVILQMEQKLKELKSEKCNVLLRINSYQTEQIINNNKKN